MNKNNNIRKLPSRDQTTKRKHTRRNNGRFRESGRCDRSRVATRGGGGFRERARRENTRNSLYRCRGEPGRRRSPPNARSPPPTTVPPAATATAAEATATTSTATGFPTRVRQCVRAYRCGLCPAPRPSLRPATHRRPSSATTTTTTSTVAAGPWIFLDTGSFARQRRRHVRRPRSLTHFAVAVFAIKRES